MLKEHNFYVICAMLMLSPHVPLEAAIAGAIWCIFLSVASLFTSKEG